MKKEAVNLLLVLLILCMAGLACSKFVNGLSRAPSMVVAISNFHLMFNDGQYADIYESMHSVLKQKTSKVEFVQFLSQVRSQYGKFISSTVKTSTNSTDQGVDMITVVEETRFDAGTENEEFLFIIEDNKAILAGYKVNVSGQK